MPTSPSPPLPRRYTKSFQQAQKQKRINEAQQRENQIKIEQQKIEEKKNAEKNAEQQNLISRYEKGEISFQEYLKLFPEKIEKTKYGGSNTTQAGKEYIAYLSSKGKDTREAERTLLPESGRTYIGIGKPFEKKTIIEEKNEAPIYIQDAEGKPIAKSEYEQFPVSKDILPFSSEKQNEPINYSPIKESYTTKDIIGSPEGAVFVTKQNFTPAPTIEKKENFDSKNWYTTPEGIISYSLNKDVVEPLGKTANEISQGYKTVGRETFYGISDVGTFIGREGGGYLLRRFPTQYKIGYTVLKKSGVPFIEDTQRKEISGNIGAFVGSTSPYFIGGILGAGKYYSDLGTTFYKNPESSTTLVGTTALLGFAFTKLGGVQYVGPISKVVGLGLGGAYIFSEGKTLYEPLISGNKKQFDIALEGIEGVTASAKLGGSIGVAFSKATALQTVSKKFDIVSRAKQLKGKIGGQEGVIGYEGEGFVTTKKELPFGLQKFVPSKFRSSGVFVETKPIRFNLTKSYKSLSVNDIAKTPNKYLQEAFQESLLVKGKNKTFLKVDAVGKDAKGNRLTQMEIIRKNIADKYIVNEVGNIRVGENINRSKIFPFNRLKGSGREEIFTIGNTSIQNTTALKEFGTQTLIKNYNVLSSYNGSPSEVKVGKREVQIKETVTGRKGTLGFTTGQGKVKAIRSPVDNTLVGYNIVKGGEVSAGSGTFSQRVFKKEFVRGPDTGIEIGTSKSIVRGKVGGVKYIVNEKVFLEGESTFASKSAKSFAEKTQLKQLKDLRSSPEFTAEGLRKMQLQNLKNSLTKETKNTTEEFKYALSRREARAQEALGEKYIEPVNTGKSYYEKRGEGPQQLREIKGSTQFNLTKKGAELINKDIPDYDTGLKVKNIVSMGKQSQPIKDISTITGIRPAQLVKKLGELPVEGFSTTQKALHPDVGAVFGQIETGKVGIAIKKLPNKLLEESAIVHELEHAGESFAGIKSGKPVSNNSFSYFQAPAERRAYAVQERFLESRGADLPAGVLFRTGVKGDTSLITRVTQKVDIQQPKIDFQKIYAQAFRTTAIPADNGSRPIQEIQPATKTLSFPTFTPTVLSKISSVQSVNTFFPLKLIPKQVTTPVTQILSRPVITPITKTTSIPITTPVTKPITTPVSRIISTPTTTTITTPVTTTVTTPVTTTVTTPVTTIPFTPTIPFAPPRSPPKKTEYVRFKQKPSFGKAFVVQTKKGGKIITLKPKLTFEDATNYGANIADRTARASFRVVETEGFAKPIGISASRTKFTLSKQKNGFLVEPRKLRLNVRSERSDVSSGRLKKFKRFIGL